VGTNWGYITHLRPQIWLVYWHNYIPLLSYVKIKIHTVPVSILSEHCRGDMSTHQGSSSSWSTRMYVDGMHWLLLPNNAHVPRPLDIKLYYIQHGSHMQYGLCSPHPRGCAPWVQHCINLTQLHHKTMCTWCRQAFWVVKSVGFIMAKMEFRLFLAICVGYANYLTANDNILGKQLCSCSPFCNHSWTQCLFATRITELY